MSCVFQASSGSPIGLLSPPISVSDFGISEVEAEPFFQIGMKNFMIVLRFGAVPQRNPLVSFRRIVPTLLSHQKKEEFDVWRMVVHCNDQMDWIQL